VVPIPVIEPTERMEEHRKIAAAHRPKQDAKRAQAAQKRAEKREEKRVKTDAANDTKVLGKRKREKRDGDGDVVMGKEG
jgi:hypothetical protein